MYFTVLIPEPTARSAVLGVSPGRGLLIPLLGEFKVDDGETLINYRLLVYFFSLSIFESDILLSFSSGQYVFPLNVFFYVSAELMERLYSRVVLLFMSQL